MTSEEISEKKREFLECLERAPERPSAACKEVGISLPTYRRWRREDSNFDWDCGLIDAAGEEEVMESLSEGARGGGVAAARLYFERRDKAAAALRSERESEGVAAPGRSEYDALVAEIVSWLEGAGKYAREMEMQVRALAMAYMGLRRAYEFTARPGYSPVFTETTKDGRVIQTIHPAELLIQRYVVEIQSALKSLGMNMDAKAWEVSGEDEMGRFLSENPKTW